MFIYADYYIAWVILHQRNLLFTYVSDLNLRNLQTSAHWQHISGGRVLNFISLGEKKRYEAKLVKSSLILQCCTNLYEKADMRISNAL